jgi:hypothetical protein
MAVQPFDRHEQPFQFVILYAIGRTPWTREQPIAMPLNTDIHASDGIRSNNSSVRSGEDISCRRPRGHCDRLNELIFT